MDFFRANRNFFYTIGVIFFLVFFYYFFFNAPADFPVGTTINIGEGLSLHSVSLELKNAHIIRSRFVFETFVFILGRQRHLIEADYYFENRLPVFEIARRILKGERHIAPVSVTIPEGFNNTEIADVFASKLANFDKNKFLAQVKELQGYLFPDTYLFLTTDTEVEVVKSMSENFNKKISPVISEIIQLQNTTRRTEKEIITMASIIEAEAKGDADRGFISGILWKRLKIGMPLQVDSAPDTYKTKGLPKSPIGNPGIAAIKAAMYPQSSPYLYYLHDKSGNIHYAKTFAQHQENVLKYLK